VLSQGGARAKVHLKRFQQNGRGRLRKIEGVVSFPLHLDLGPFCEVAPAPTRCQQSAIPSMQRTRTALCVQEGKAGRAHALRVGSGGGERQLPASSSRALQGAAPVSRGRAPACLQGLAAAQVRRVSGRAKPVRHGDL